MQKTTLATVLTALVKNRPLSSVWLVGFAAVVAHCSGSAALTTSLALEPQSAAQTPPAASLPAGSTKAADSPAKSVVPFEMLVTNHMLVEARINGKGPFRLIFDLGSAGHLAQ